MADADMGAEDGADLDTLKQRNQDLQRALLEAQHSADTRLIAAELRAEAQRSGMVDLDGLKLLRDPGAVVVENGEVKGARQALALLRQEKPWLFGEKSSSSTAAAPATARPQAKLATEMTLEEWRRARAELIKRR
jgi:hypothetical protein